MSKLVLNCLRIFISFFLMHNLSCDKTVESSEENSQEATYEKSKVSTKDIEQIKFTEFALSDLAIKNTVDWLKFQELQENIELIKKGNLSFFGDDKAIIEAFITDLKTEVPETIKIPSILVRLSVLETTIFKLESIANLSKIENELLLDAIKDVLVANSNVILQLNKKIEKDSQKIKKPD